MYITWFCYIWMVVVLSFIPSAPKLVNFPHFLDSRSWEKTCVYIICIYVHMYICTYVYMYICIYVHMHICTYVYYMILLYLEGSGSKFHSVNTKTSQFSSFLDSRSWGKNMSTPKLANFPFFGFQELRKNMCIYIYMCICQLFPTISPHFMGSSIANGISFSS